MFDEVLKYGAYIVDNLVDYKQPVFVYIPPFAELRGGAWVVVDPTINIDMMEMYADVNSRGGILEPDGTVEVKFRKVDLLKAMTRLDTQYVFPLWSSPLSACGTGDHPCAQFCL